MRDPNGRARRGQDARAGLRPFDENDRVVEVRLEVTPLGVRELREPVEVEVRDVDVAVVAVADGVRRARDRLRDSERAGRAADERRLPRPELSEDRDDVARAQRRGQTRAERLGVCGGRGLDDVQKRPSCTAACGATSTGSGFGTGSTTRPSNSGSRRKSPSSTSSIFGVYSAAAGW